MEDYFGCTAAITDRIKLSIRVVIQLRNFSGCIIVEISKSTVYKPNLSSFLTEYAALVLFSLVHCLTDYTMYFSYAIFRCCMCVCHMLLKYYLLAYLLTYFGHRGFGLRLRLNIFCFALLYKIQNLKPKPSSKQMIKSSAGAVKIAKTTNRTKKSTTASSKKLPSRMKHVGYWRRTD